MSGTDSTRGRIAVTGIGAVTPLGLDVASSWAACRRGQSGIAPITLFNSSNLATHIAGELKEFNPESAMERKAARRASRAIQLSIAATREAIADSGLDIAAESEEVGVLVGSGIGGLEILEKAVLALERDGPRRISPFTVPSMIADMPAGMIAIETGARGPNLAIVSACASGGHAIGEAAEWIRRGDAVAVICGGTEAAITPIGIASFNAMQALSTHNDEPERASRPFDMARDGFVMGEGAGILVLEDWDHAIGRGAHIHAEVVGYGATADASHITAPPEDGNGARRAVQRALKRAGLAPTDVDYINAHGTSTQLNDSAETTAIKAALGEAAAHIPMSSTKSMHGHLLGAAGAVEAVLTIKAIHDQFAPPTINLENPDPACDLDYVPNVGREVTINHAISTSFGFGGHNCCIVLARYAGA